MALRVIAGRQKGRRLATPTWDGLRPTSDRLRQTLFDVLGARVAGARVLDVFAGTGAVGIEALSRGAAHVTFVEDDRRALALIERNLAGCGIAGGYTVRARRWPAPPEAGPPVDIAWLDPPYGLADLAGAVAAACAWTTRAGLVVLEHAARRDPPDPPAGWRLARRLRAGDSALTFYAAGDEAATAEPPP